MEKESEARSYSIVISIPDLSNENSSQSVKYVLYDISTDRKVREKQN